MHNEVAAVAGRAGQVVGQPVLVVPPDRGGDQVIHKLSEGGHVLVLFALRVSPELPDDGFGVFLMKFIKLKILPPVQQLVPVRRECWCRKLKTFILQRD